MNEKTNKFLGLEDEEKIAGMPKICSGCEKDELYNEGARLVELLILFVCFLNNSGRIYNEWVRTIELKSLIDHN